MATSLIGVHIRVLCSLVLHLSFIVFRRMITIITVNNIYLFNVLHAYIISYVKGNRYSKETWNTSCYKGMQLNYCSIFLSTWLYYLCQCMMTVTVKMCLFIFCWAYAGFLSSFHYLLSNTMKQGAYRLLTLLSNVLVVKKFPKSSWNSLYELNILSNSLYHHNAKTSWFPTFLLWIIILITTTTTTTLYSSALILTLNLSTVVSS